MGGSRLSVPAAFATAALALLAGCSTGGAHRSAAGTGTRSTPIGTVAVSPAGLTLYELEGNTAAHPECTGGCLAVWPAAVAGGHQVVLGGHPAFTFSGDRAPGQANGQGVHDQWGTWYALGPGGAPVRASPPSAGGNGY